MKYIIQATNRSGRQGYLSDEGHYLYSSKEYARRFENKAEIDIICYNVSRCCCIPESFLILVEDEVHPQE